MKIIKNVYASITASGRSFGIAFSGTNQYRAFLECWERFLAKEKRCRFLSDNPKALKVDIVSEQSEPYIYGKIDYTENVLSLRVSDTWVRDVLILWSEIELGSDEDSEYLLPRKKQQLGSRRNGWDLTVYCYLKPFVYGNNYTIELV